MQRILTAFFIGGLTLVSAAQQPEPVQPAAPAPVAPAPEVKPAPKPVEPPVIALLDAGAEPRQLLRLAPTVGLEQSNLLRIQMNVSLDMGQGEIPTSLPAMLVTMKLKVSNISPEGDISYAATIPECSVEQTAETAKDMADMMNAALAPMKRLTGTCTITSRGVAKESKFVVPQDLAGDAAAAASGLGDQLGQLGAQFPEEAVGAGARWTVKSKIHTQGMPIDQTATFTLTEVREGTAFLKVDLEQTAAGQKLDTPGIPPGATVMLESLSSKGGGTMEIPLAMIAPARAESKLASSLALTISQGGQESKMKQTVKLDMTVSPAPAAAAPAAPPTVPPAAADH